MNSTNHFRFEVIYGANCVQRELCSLFSSSEVVVPPSPASFLPPPIASMFHLLSVLFPSPLLLFLLPNHRFLFSISSVDKAQVMRFPDF